MKKGSFLYSGSVSGLLENAKGCVWNCTVQNAEEARLLEANYSISSKPVSYTHLDVYKRQTL